MQEKKTQTQQPTQNIQMMRSETHEDGPSVNIVTWSGIATGADKGKKLEENVWVHKAVDREVGCYLNKENETFMEAKRRFANAGASTSKA